MWEGGCQKITSENLASIDADVPTDTITYRITGNWWGNLEMKANSTALNHFTQEQIDKGMVYFNHTSKYECLNTHNLPQGQYYYMVY